MPCGCAVCLPSYTVPVLSCCRARFSFISEPVTVSMAPPPVWFGVSCLHHGVGLATPAYLETATCICFHSNEMTRSGESQVLLFLLCGLRYKNVNKRKAWEPVLLKTRVQE